MCGKPKQVRAAVLLHYVGEEAKEVVKNMELTIEEKRDPDTLIRILDEYYLPKCNPSVETHKFNNRNELPNETFADYFKELKALAVNCDFGTCKERVSGIKDQIIKDRLLREPELNLTRAIEISKEVERTDEPINQKKKYIIS